VKRSPERGWAGVARLRLEVLGLLRLAERRLAVVLVLAALAAGVLPLAFTLSVGALVGAIPGVVRAGFDSPAGGRLGWLLAVTTVVFAALQVLSPVQQGLREIVRRQINETVRERALVSLMRPAGIAHLEDPELRDHLSLIQEGSPMIQAAPGGAAVTTVEFLSIYLQGVGGAVLVGWFFSWWAAGVLLGTGLFARRHLRRGQLEYIWTSLEPEQNRFHRRYHYDRKVGIGGIAAKEARVFGLRDWFIARFRDDWRQAFREVDARRERMFRQFGIAYLVLACGYTLTYVFVAGAAAAGTLPLGALAVVVQAAFNIATLSRQGTWDWELEFGTVVLPKIRELEATAAAASPASAPGTGRSGGKPPADGIRFEGVSFRYRDTDRDVLSDLDLFIPSGRSLAIVGPNGAGKTTLVKLLACLYEPTAGRITVDGADLAGLDRHRWQRQIAVIFQDFVRYDLPARENVGFGAVSRLADTAALAAAAAKARVLPVIEALPGGWDTVLSRQYTGGADLSGGEWQRVALARCHLAIEAGAKILVLDEPTASLDVRAEAEFFTRFIELTEGLTTVLISHRFSTVRAAGRVVVLDSGRIREDGSHRQLLALGGMYAEMFRLQAGRLEAAAEETGG
jgi:ATP-binding cassette subfamily B protein